MDVLCKIEHKLREVLAGNEIGIVIYLDLKNAFDKVWLEGLVYKLIDKGIKGYMLTWIHSYLQNRKFKVKLEGEYSDSIQLESGVQQGAVLSPILFNLMLSDIPEMENIDVFIYADDITVMSKGNNMKEVRNSIEEYLKIFDQWVKVWGLEISLRKTYMQYFTKRRVRVPIIKMNNRKIEYVREYHLLGLRLDSPRLTFKSHIRYLIADGSRRLDLLKSIASTQWGASSKILKNFYIAYIRAKIDYGAILYGGGSETELTKLDILQNKCLRLILGARKSTPILSMQVEAYIPPLTLHREYLTLKEFIKICHNPDKAEINQVLGMDSANSMGQPFNSFVSRALKSPLKKEMTLIKRIPTQIMMLPPWLSLEKYIVEEYDEMKVFDESTWRCYKENNYAGYLEIYTDGSKIANKELKTTASAIYILQIKKAINWKLRPEHSVISSELFALEKALQFIKGSIGAENYIILTDSRSSLQLIKANNDAYTGIVSKIQELLLQLNSERSVILHWIRGHSNVRGNEIVDQAAKKGHENNKSVLFNLSKSEEISCLKGVFYQYWNDCWTMDTNISQKGLFLQKLRGSLKHDTAIDNINHRRSEVVLRRLRMGHVGLNQYLHRFGMNDTNMCEACGVPETVEHYLLFCGKYNVARNTMKHRLANLNLQFTIKNLLGCNYELGKENLSILRSTIKYIKTTNKMDIL